MNQAANGSTGKMVRCAVYTRKSTEEGQRQFTSLDAQREAAEAYIASQQHEGWLCLPDRYDDGGFTGGNMDRPAARSTRGRPGVPIRGVLRQRRRGRPAPRPFPAGRTTTPANRLFDSD